MQFLHDISTTFEVLFQVKFIYLPQIIIYISWDLCGNWYIQFQVSFPLYFDSTVLNSKVFFFLVTFWFVNSVVSSLLVTCNLWAICLSTKSSKNPDFERNNRLTNKSPSVLTGRAMNIWQIPMSKYVRHAQGKHFIKIPMSGRPDPLREKIWKVNLPRPIDRIKNEE